MLWAMIRAVTTVVVMLSLGAATRADVENSGFVGDINEEPIQYGSVAVDDRVARLQKRLDSGTARLAHEPRHGYLRSVLRELGIDPASQVLAFAKTSLQTRQI